MKYPKQLYLRFEKLIALIPPRRRAKAQEDINYVSEKILTNVDKRGLWAMGTSEKKDSARAKYIQTITERSKIYDIYAFRVFLEEWDRRYDNQSLLQPSLTLKEAAEFVGANPGTLRSRIYKSKDRVATYKGDRPLSLEERERLSLGEHESYLFAVVKRTDDQNLLSSP